MTIVAVVPSSRAAIATACAWLPDEYASTPRAQLVAGSDAILLYAPRNLNAPPRWKHSAFRCTDAPTSSSSVRDVKTGVRWATPSRRRAAACDVGEVDHRHGFARGCSSPKPQSLPPTM